MKKDDERIKKIAHEWIIEQGHTSTIGLNAYPAYLGFIAGAQAERTGMREEYNSIVQSLQDTIAERNILKDEIERLRESHPEYNTGVIRVREAPDNARQRSGYQQNKYL